MFEDLFELIGGHSTIEAATELFYDKVLHDQNLRFISMLLAGRVYTGKGLHDAHARSRDSGLTGAQFDLFLKHFRAALVEVGVKSENAEIIRKRLESQRRNVLDT
jgi:truncated hemoglobin YjbI